MRWEIEQLGKVDDVGRSKFDVSVSMSLLNLVEISYY